MPHKYNLTNLRLSKRKSVIANKITENAPRYPYGLEINLNKEVLQKLGEKAEDFTVGKEIYLLAKATVTGIRVSDSVGSSSKNVDLQVTAMKLQYHSGTEKENTHKTKKSY